MADYNPVKELVNLLAQSRVVLSGDIKPELIQSIDLDLIASKILESHKDSGELKIVTADEVRKIVEQLKVEKAPTPIEVIRSSTFKPIAAEMDAQYKIGNRPSERTQGTAMDFVNYFNSRVRKIRAIVENTRGAFVTVLPNLLVLKSLIDRRDVCVIGIVSNKITTKNGNVMVVLEDDTGDAKVIFMRGTSQQSASLFESSQNIINDEVIAIKGKISGPFVIASEILWPDVPIKETKTVDEDIAIAFMSDIHVGSKRFMEKNFYNMIQWINGNVEGKHKELASKIKYIVIAGDVVDGIGIYPGQDRELAIVDIYAQYKKLFSYMEAIPDYIHVFMLPGNHDAVQLSEPQPPLTSELLSDFKKDNIHMLSNPGSVTLHGVETLAYHGKALDAMISSIPGLSYAQPEKAMIELLKRRHISPVYGNQVSSTIVPSKEDNLVIEKVPDILHMGHVHKNGLAEYHGVQIVNSGTWQSRTDFQIRQGHIPTPCVLPIYEMKTRTFSSVNFAGE